MKDFRSRKVTFLAYCLLDQNARAEGIAEHAGPVTEILMTLIRNRVGMVQMPCPELHHEGFDRPPHPKSWYDNEEFRDVCRKCAEQVSELAGKYVKNKHKIVGIIGVENSPSCAVEVLQVKGNGERRLEKGRGVFIEELLEELDSVGSTGAADSPFTSSTIEPTACRFVVLVMV